MFKDFQVKTISKDVNGACKFIKKETLAQVFSCEFCKLFKTKFFTEHIWATAPDVCVSGCKKCWFFKTTFLRNKWVIP